MLFNIHFVDIVDQWYNQHRMG